MPTTGLSTLHHLCLPQASKTEAKGKRAEEMGTAEGDSKVTSSEAPCQSNIYGQGERSFHWKVQQDRHRSNRDWGSRMR